MTARSKLTQSSLLTPAEVATMFSGCRYRSPARSLISVVPQACHN